MKLLNMRASSGLGTGSVSLILVFAVLCLTIFALLTVSSAKSEYDLSHKTADSVTAYYQADAMAENIFAQIKASLNEGQSFSESISGIKINHTSTDSYDSTYISFNIPVDDVNLLAVGLIYYSQSRLFDIKQWQLVPAVEWQPQDDFKVWDGELNTGN